MNTNEHIDLLQQVHGNVADILWRPTETPDDIQTTPATIIKSVGLEAEVIGAGESCIDVTTTYQVYLLAGFAGLNAFGAKADDAYRISDLMITEYHRASVEGLPTVTGEYPRLVLDYPASITHTGLIRFAFNPDPDMVFTAIQFTLRIQDQRDFP